MTALSHEQYRCSDGAGHPAQIAELRREFICGYPGCVPIVCGACPLNSMTYAGQQYLSVPIVCALAPLFAGHLMVRGPAACGGDAGVSGEEFCCSCGASRAVIVRVG